MNLYLVTNGYMGESYVRVYAWAPDEAAALAMARQAFLQNNPHNHDPSWCERLATEKLMTASEHAFCTKPSDSGFDR